MSETTYNSLKEAVNAAVQQFNTHPEFDRALIQQLVEREDLIDRLEIQPTGEAVGNAYEAYSKSIRYVIRNDLLFSLENFLDLLKHAAGFSVALLALMSAAGLPAGIKGVIDSVHGLAASYRRIIKLGHRPTPEEFAIFAALKDMKSGTTQQIVNVLNGVDAGKVEQALSKYGNTADQNTGFVKRNGQGHWYLVGF